MSHHVGILQGQVILVFSLVSTKRPEIWKLQKVVLDYNQYLASPNKLHNLKSQRLTANWSDKGSQDESTPGV
jgi:hypothetical protein